MSGERFRVITTRGRSHPSLDVYGRQEALAAAEARFAATGIPAMVVHHPEGGLVRPVDVVGQAKAPRR